MTHLLIVEPDAQEATRVVEALAPAATVVVGSIAEALDAVSGGTIRLGIAACSAFRDPGQVRKLRVIPWIALSTSPDEELATQRSWPALHLQFLARDARDRYLDLLPYRVQAVDAPARVLSTITEHFPGMVAYWDADERCRYGNAAYRRWLGRDEEEMIGATLRELLGPLYALNERYIRGALRGEPQRFERTIPQLGGAPPLHVLATYTPDLRNGVVIGFVVLITDITEQDQLRLALEERERRAATLFDVLPVGVAILDERNDILEFNRALQSILSIDREGLEAGRYRSRKYVDADGQPFGELPSQRARQEQRTVGPVEIGVVKEDGSTIWTSVTAAPFPGENHVVVVTRDTTEEKAGDARFKAMLDASPIASAVTDAEGRISYVNAAFVTAFGYTRQDVPTVEEWWKRAYPDEAYRRQVIEEWRTRRARTTQEGGIFEALEVTLRTKAGSDRIVRVGAAWLSGSLAGVHLVVLIDVTEQRHAEAARLAAEKQRLDDQKMAALGALAGGVAHDFNNILMSIVANAEMALHDVGPSSPVADALTNIETAAQRAAALVRQILSASKPGGETKSVVDICSLAHEVVRLLRASLPSRITIRQELAPSCPPVLADPTRIHQVILNLATNARDAMEAGGGVLTVSVDSPEPSHVVITVSDTGSGMAPDIAERAFEPYFTTKARDKGTGLGLATVHAIVTALGGQVAIDSELGRGTSVRVTLPAAKLGAARPTQARTPPAQGSGEHVLVVDDERAVAGATVRMLRRLGYRTTMVADPAEALALVRSDPSISVLLADYTMPGMTGLELAEAVAKVRPLPVLLATGFAECLPEAAITKAGIRRVLPKPYASSALSEALTAVLDGGPARS